MEEGMYCVPLLVAVVAIAVTGCTESPTESTTKPTPRVVSASPTSSRSPNVTATPTPNPTVTAPTSLACRRATREEIAPVGASGWVVEVGDGWKMLAVDEGDTISTYVSNGERVNYGHGRPSPDAVDFNTRIGKTVIVGGYDAIELVERCAKDGKAYRA